MKVRLLPILAIIALSSGTNAQVIFENGGYESWVDNGGYQEPEGWFSLNQLTQFGIDPSVTMTTIAHTGNKAALLTTIENSTQNVPGLLSSGPLMNSEGDVNFDQAKIAFSARPVGFTFAYMYAPGVGDTCSVYMLLTKWNSALNKADTVAEGRFASRDSVMTYTVKMIDFDYYNNQIPDSAFIIISASKNGFEPVPGTTMYIDDFYLRYMTGLTDAHLNDSKVKLYPSPVASVLHVEGLSTGSTLSIFNTLGVKVAEQHITTVEEGLNVASLTPGVYYVVATEGKNSYTRKFVKQ